MKENNIHKENVGVIKTMKNTRIYHLRREETESEEAVKK